MANILRRCVAEDPARRPSARRLLRQLRGLRFPQGAAVNKFKAAAEQKPEAAEERAESAGAAAGA